MHLVCMCSIRTWDDHEKRPSGRKCQPAFTKPFHHWSKPHEAKALTVCRFALCLSKYPGIGGARSLAGVSISPSVSFCLHFGKPDNAYFISLLLTCLMGLLITHFMRFCIFFPESARKTAQNTDPLFYHHDRSFCGPVWLFIRNDGFPDRV